MAEDSLDPSEPFRKVGGRKFLISLLGVVLLTGAPLLRPVPPDYYTAVSAIVLAFIAGNAAVSVSALRHVTVNETVQRQIAERRVVGDEDGTEPH